VISIDLRRVQMTSASTNGRLVLEESPVNKIKSFNEIHIGCFIGIS